MGYEQRYCTPKNLLINKLRYALNIFIMVFILFYRTVDSKEPFPLVYDKTTTLVNTVSCLAEKQISLRIPDSTGWLNQNFLNEVQRSTHTDSQLVCSFTIQNYFYQSHWILDYSPRQYFASLGVVFNANSRTGKGHDYIGESGVSFFCCQWYNICYKSPLYSFRPTVSWYSKVSKN